MLYIVKGFEGMQIKKSFYIELATQNLWELMLLLCNTHNLSIISAYNIFLHITLFFSGPLKNVITGFYCN